MGLWASSIKRAETGEERIGDRLINKKDIELVLNRMRCICFENEKLRGYKIDADITGDTITWDIADKKIETTIDAKNNTLNGILISLLVEMFEKYFEESPFHELYLKMTVPLLNEEIDFESLDTLKDISIWTNQQ